jgi:hypothetical protein
MLLELQPLTELGLSMPFPKCCSLTRAEAGHSHRMCCAVNVISNHTCLRTHLHRNKITDNQLCECGEDYDTLDHVLWACERFRAERRPFLQEQERLGTQIYVPVRVLLGGRFWKGLQSCGKFFKQCGLAI